MNTFIRQSGIRVYKIKEKYKNKTQINNHTFYKQLIKIFINKNQLVVQTGQIHYPTKI